jgi:hypothetical protein
MLSGRVRLLDLDGSVAAQADFVREVAAERVDLTRLGPAARLWASRPQVEAIRAALDPAAKDAITFLGSGDFHHVSALLLEQFQEPVTLVVFDHHPDWDRLPPRRGCGAWISRALEQGNIGQIFLVGNASSDLAFPSVVTGSRAAARSGRVVLLPYELAGPQVWPFRFPARELKPDPVGVFAGILPALAGRRVYVSIDKDCLGPAAALTNWEEGRLPLSLLLTYLSLLQTHCDLVGVDVTGEYSPALPAGRWKRWCSDFDHPRAYSALGRGADAIARVNAQTNRQIVHQLRHGGETDRPPPIF